MPRESEEIPAKRSWRAAATLVEAPSTDLAAPDTDSDLQQWLCAEALRSKREG
jgi:hypothetical protein